MAKVRLQKSRLWKGGYGVDYFTSPYGPGFAAGALAEDFFEPINREKLMDDGILSDSLSFDQEAFNGRNEELDQSCKPKRDLPCGFFFSGDKLMFRDDFAEDDPAILVCNRLEVIAYVRDDLQESFGKVLQFRDADGHLHVWVMPMALLAGDGTEYRKELLSRGLQINPNRKARELLTKYILLSEPGKKMRCVSKVGWYKDVFVLPEEVISIEREMDDGETPILQAPFVTFPDFRESGTLEEWQQNIAMSAKGNSRLILGISAGFAPPFLNLVSGESGGIHFRGDSSKGKSTIQIVANSIWGSKTRKLSWRSTVNGLEGVASAHNDTLLCLDEIGQVDPAKIGEIAYLLANGVGKNRSRSDGSHKKPSLWNLMFLSSGEMSLSDLMSSVGQRIKAGQELRIIDIPSGSLTYGAFETIHQFPDGRMFADHLLQQCNKFYGVVGKEFLKVLVASIKKNDFLPSIRKTIDEFVAKQADVDGQVKRIASKFGLLIAAGKFASQMRLTGWDEKEVEWGIEKCFSDWLQNRETLGSSEERNFILGVQSYFQTYGNSYFEDFGGYNEKQPIKRIGFRKADEGFYVFPETLRSELCKGIDFRWARKVLFTNGYLDSVEAKSVWVPGLGKSARFYLVTNKILGVDTENLPTSSF